MSWIWYPITQPNCSCIRSIHITSCIDIYIAHNQFMYISVNSMHILYYSVLNQYSYLCFQFLLFIPFYICIQFQFSYISDLVSQFQLNNQTLFRTYIVSELSYITGQLHQKLEPIQLIILVVGTNPISIINSQV